MNFYACLVIFAIAIIFLYFQLEWLGFVFLLMALMAFLYNPIKKHADKAWEEANKAEANYPAGKLEAYSKGFSKQAAEYLIQTPDTEYNFRKGTVLHKTHTGAKNFFSELKELFK
jgi:hypothetical protein